MNPWSSKLRNLRLDVAYDGSDFSGWQRQPDRPTIQGCIEAAIEQVTGEKPNLTGSGRTDAGVHAAGQVANFTTASPIPCANLNRALNHLLPATVRILGVNEAPLPFHARYDARAKVYRYRILQARVCPPFVSRFVHHYAGQLDREQMMRAAALLEGEHDFTSFCAAEPFDGGADNDTGSQGAPVRRVFQSRMIWNPRTSILTYEVRGNGFLRHMVRTVAGTLIEVGRGAISAHAIRSILEAKHRSAAGPTAPARALCLVRVEY